MDGETGLRIAQLRRMTGDGMDPFPAIWVEVLFRSTTGQPSSNESRRVRLRWSVAVRRDAQRPWLQCRPAGYGHGAGKSAPRFVILDQLLAFAELERIGAAVIFTKPDLVDPGAAEAAARVYREIGYPTQVVNPKTGDNVPALRELIRGRQALLAGNSGVGKSSIFRALGGDSAVGEVSRHGLGRQTTTAGRLYRLEGGFLIDSPGINEFGLGTIAHDALSGAFPELRDVRCRFTDCTHLREPDCAVLAAVAQDRIAPTRYASYRKILLEPT